jgi:hypothetical protein
VLTQKRVFIPELSYSNLRRIIDIFSGLSQYLEAGRLMECINRFLCSGYLAPYVG